MTNQLRQVAIVGAGMAGLACAQELQGAGVSVALFDKGFKRGGRLATRHSATQHDYDHGAQYMTAVDPRFRASIGQWQAKGWVQPWEGRIIRIETDGHLTYRTRTHWVAVPGMNSLAQHLGDGLIINTGCQVSSLVKRNDTWWVMAGQSEYGPYSDVLVTVPVPQAIALLIEHAPCFLESLTQVEMMPCWAVMVTFADAPDVPYEAAHIIGRSPLGWIANNASKPGRKPDPCWVLHANARWSLTHLDAEPEWVIQQLLHAWEAQLGHALPRPTETIAHRWRYARATRPLGVASAYDPALRLGVAGDWCLNQKVEAAYLSGSDLAERAIANTAGARSLA